MASSKNLCIFGSRSLPEQVTQGSRSRWVVKHLSIGPCYTDLGTTDGDPGWSLIKVVLAGDTRHHVILTVILNITLNPNVTLTPTPTLTLTRP